MQVHPFAVVAAAVPGLIALIAVIMLALRMRRMRAAQTTLLPDGTSAPLVDTQATMRNDITDIRRALEDLRALVDTQAETTARELARSLRFQGLVRYDAYGDMGGSQSWSIALLDDTANGTVITCLHARDHARVYLKEVVGGDSAQRLSPEEQRAIALATGSEPRPVAA